MIHRIAIAISGIILLSGCVGIAGSNRSPVDQAYSWYEGKDCSLSRGLRGRSLCREDEVEPLYAGHCFATLGEVSCYNDPRPFPGGQPKVGGMPPTAEPKQQVTRVSADADVPPVTPPSEPH